MIFKFQECATLPDTRERLQTLCEHKRNDFWYLLVTSWTPGPQP